MHPEVHAVGGHAATAARKADHRMRRHAAVVLLDLGDRPSGEAARSVVPGGSPVGVFDTYPWELPRPHEKRWLMRPARVWHQPEAEDEPSRIGAYVVERKDE